MLDYRPKRNFVVMGVAKKNIKINVPLWVNVSARSKAEAKRNAKKEKNWIVDDQILEDEISENKMITRIAHGKRSKISIVDVSDDE